MGEPISVIPDSLTAVEMAGSKPSLRFVADKLDASPSPKTYQVPCDQLEMGMGLYPMMNRASHGLASTDEGKALFGYKLLDDTTNTEICTGVFYKLIDVNNFRYATCGHSIWVPAAVMPVGYDITTSQRFLYWDASVSSVGSGGRWATAMPIDSDPTTLPQLMVNSYSSTFTAYNCTVLGYGPGYGVY